MKDFEWDNRREDIKLRDSSDKGSSISASPTQFETYVSQLQVEIEDLRLQLTRSEAQNQEKMRDLERFESENFQLKGEISRLREDLQRRETLTQLLKDQNRKLKLTLSGALESGALKPEHLAYAEELDRSFDSGCSSYVQSADDCCDVPFSDPKASKSPPFPASRLSLFVNAANKRSSSPANKPSELEEIRRTLNELKSNIDNHSERSNGNAPIIKHAQEVA